MSGAWDLDIAFDSIPGWLSRVSPLLSKLAFQLLSPVEKPSGEFVDLNLQSKQESQHPFEIGIVSQCGNFISHGLCKFIQF